MAELSFMEKINKLISNFNTSTIIIMICLVLLMILVYFLRNKERKYSYLVYIAIVVLSGYCFKNALFKLIDMFIERLFYLFYFPTGAVYMITLVISHVCLLYSIGKKKIDKTTKYINYTGFTLMQILFVNILNYLSKNNVDLTNELNFVSDKNMISLLEISMIIFTLWMAILIIKSMANVFAYAVLSSEYDSIKVEEESKEKVNVLDSLSTKLNTVYASVKEKQSQKKVISQVIERVDTKNEETMEREFASSFIPEQITSEPLVESVIQIESEPVDTVKAPKMDTKELMDFLLKPETNFKPLEVTDDKVKYNIPTEPIYNDSFNDLITKVENSVKEEVQIVKPINISEIEKPQIEKTIENILKPEVKTNKLQSEIKWSKAVIDAMNIPSEPIYNDVTDKLVIESITKDQPLEETFLNIENMEIKQEKKTTNVKEMYQKLLHGEDDSNYTLEDYIELKKYLVASK